MPNASDSDDEQQPVAVEAPGQLDNSELPALFWDTMPEDAEQHPDYAALQALRDEATPEERAETYKVNGNNKLKIGLQAKNKHVLREAVEFYDKGLAEKCSDKKLNAVLHCNRAHVHSLLGNWRHCLEDCQSALSLDPSYVKAYFRGARAALKLSKFDLCMSLVSQGRTHDPGAKEWPGLEQEAEAGLAKVRAEEERRRAAEETRLAPARALAAAISKRGYQVTLPQVRTRDSWRPSLDPQSDSLHWPCLILYPEAGSQDEIQAWPETETVHDQLDQMFGPQAPPLEWDQGHEYSRDRVELYYLSWAGKPLTQEQLIEVFATGHWPASAHVDAATPTRYGEKASRWVRVKEDWTLHDVLSQKDMVVPGIPMFAAVARGTEFRQRFLRQNDS